MPETTGTVTDPVWYTVLTLLFLGLAAAIILMAVSALVVRYAERRAESLAWRRKPLPRATVTRWLSDAETPIGNQLLREYTGVSP